MDSSAVSGKYSIKDLKDALIKPKNLDHLEKIIESILETTKTEFSDLDRMLYREITTMSRYIRDTRQMLASIPLQVNFISIPSATDELDVVVIATEEATGKILDATEKIEAIGAKLNASENEAILSLVTQIYEACSFQDISGQRIRKVIGTLKYIEHNLNDLLTRFSDGILRNEIKRTEAVEEIIDPSFLSGPELPKNAKNQDEIDKLFSISSNPK